MSIAVVGHISSIEAHDLGLVSADGARLPVGMASGTMDVDGLRVQSLRVSPPTRMRPDVVASLVRAGLPAPVHMLVPVRADAFATRRVIPHGWSYVQPWDDLARVEIECPANVFACPPEMALMQMARGLGVAKTALLVDQVLGTYRACRPEAIESYGQIEGVSIESCTDECGTATAYGLSPLTAIVRLSNYLDAMAGAPGARSVRRSLPLVADGLASPLEAQTYALAFCSRHTGSLGLPKPLVNHRVEVPIEARGCFGSAFIRPDFWWPEQRVALEVLGVRWHDGAQGITQTSMREKGYYAMGASCITITEREIRMLSSFEAAMAVLAKLLGVKLRPPTKAFEKMRGQLRTEVLDVRPAR